MISRISEWQIMKTNPRGLSVWRQILLLAALSGSRRWKKQQMRSVSIKGLGLIMVQCEATYAAKGIPGPICNAAALNLFLTWILVHTIKRSKHFFFHSFLTSGALQQHVDPNCTWIRDDLIKAK